MHDQLRDRLLGMWAAVVCDHPRVLLTIALAIAAGCVYLTVTNLGFQPDRNALISETLPWNARYIEYRKRFAHDGLTVVVAVPDEEGGQAKARAFTEALGVKLSCSEHVDSALWKIDVSQPNAAIRMLPMAEYERVLGATRQVGPIIEGANLPEMLAQTIRSMSSNVGQMDSADAIDGLNRLAMLLETINAAVADASDPVLSYLLAEAASGPAIYLEGGAGELLFIQVEPARDESELEPVAPAVQAVRALIDEAKAKHPGIEAGLTGVPVIEADETEVTRRDATLASIVAVVLIGVMLVVAFHSYKMPIVVLVALGVGIAWSFGYLTLAIGHLQLLSVVFTVILLGLGVDFAIHIVSRFEMVRDAYPSGVPGFRETMIDTLRTMGPGIITGALTTAAAFATTALTDFQGMAEMGQIAGVGIVLCLVSMLVVLPALMRVFRPRRRHVKPLADRNVHLYQHHWWEPFFSRPRRTIGVALILTVLAGWAARDIRYDYDLSNLLPRDVDSVKWFNRIAEGGGQGESGGSSVWFGASIVEDGDMDELRRRVNLFRKTREVASVGGAGWMIPENDALKIEMALRLRDEMGAAMDPAAPLSDRKATMAEWRGACSLIGLALQQGKAMPGVQEDPELLKAMDKTIAVNQGLLAKLNANEDTAGLDRLHGVFVDWRAQLRTGLMDALSDRPIVVDDLPEVIRRIAVERGGDGLMIQVFPKGNVYKPSELTPFIESIRAVDPEITGTAMQIYRSNALMISSYLRAGLFAIIAVVLIVLVDFQRIGDALLCLIPVGMAFVMMLGVLALVGMPINPANIIVLPLMFGIGVDCGVHITHRFRTEPEGEPPGLSAGTGKAVWLTSMTSIIGFASLMIASHRGIYSLGFTLSMGLALNLLICLTVMPSILLLRARKNGHAD